MPRLPINALQWALDHADQLRPPVCNKCIFRGDEIECMLVAGPNDRTDFHINPTEEFFYQVRGDLILTVIEHESRREIIIREGECFLLAAMIPHNPKRAECTLGLVIERRRPTGVLDKIAWYCKECNRVLQEHSFHCEDLEINLLEAINASPALDRQICDQCAEYSIK